LVNNAKCLRIAQTNGARAEIKIAQATRKSPIADQSNVEETKEFFEEVEDLFYASGIAD